MKGLVIIYLLLAEMFLASGSEAQDQSILNEYLQTAVANNPGLQASFQRYYAALQHASQAGTLPDPEVMMGYYILPVETRVGQRNFDVSLSQSFPWFGTLKVKKDQASKEAEAQYAVFLQHKNNLFFDVKEAYYQLYAVQKSISITEDYLDILKRDERNALNRVETGETTMADVLRVQMEIKEKKTQLEFYRDRTTSLESHFNALLNRTSEAKVVVQDSLNVSEISMNNQVLMDSILSNNPTLQELHKQQEALLGNVAVAKKSGLPSFGVGLNYALVNKRTDSEINIPRNGQNVLMPMVTIGVPLNRKKYKAMVKEAEYRKNGLSLDIKKTENDLQAELIDAINQFKDADRKVHLYRELLVQARQVLRILTKSYTGGLSDYDEVLRADRQLLEYNLQLERARADCNITLALVEKIRAKNSK